jgi:hypothetical protein
MTMTAMSTKAKRANAAKTLAEIANKFGASVSTLDGGRTLDVSITYHNEASVLIGLNWGKDDTYLAHWNSKSRRFRPDFFSVNRYHGMKSTTYAPDFITLCALVQSGLRQISKGTAFIDGESL